MSNSRWMALLEGVERLQAVVAATEATVAAEEDGSCQLVDGLREIRRRLVTELRPLLLHKLRELAALQPDAARDLIGLLERSPSLVHGFPGPRWGPPSDGETAQPVPAPNGGAPAEFAR